MSGWPEINLSSPGRANERLPVNYAVGMSGAVARRRALLRLKQALGW